MYKRQGGTYPEFQMVERLRRTQDEGYGSLVVLRGDLIIDHIVFRNPFVPDTLPDAALGGVEHAAAVQSCLLYTSSWPLVMRVMKRWAAYCRRWQTNWGFPQMLW